MENAYYYIYCKGLLGVKTNIKDFKWVYGCVAPSSTRDKYEECIIKFDITVKPEKQLGKGCVCDRRFQAYAWNEENKAICYRRTLFSKFDIGYNLKINGNTVYAEFGEHYYKFVKNRIMNLHGVYYLLADLANMMLLKNGFLTLYASAVYYEPKEKCVAILAPPNTGKSCTASKLCDNEGYKFVGEDIVVSDGQKVYSCPWTSSYRKVDRCKERKTVLSNLKEQAYLTDLAVLSLGKKNTDTDKAQILKRVSLLNGYLFNYYSSPIVKILGYFNNEYYKEWNEDAKAMLKTITDTCNCYEIKSEVNSDFTDALRETVFGEKL